MTKLSIKDWVKKKLYHNPLTTYHKKDLTDLSLYDHQIQSLLKPSDFNDLSSYIAYCEVIQTQLHRKKWEDHQKLSLALGLILDEFHLLTDTPSEQLLSQYINYLKDDEVKN